MKHFLMLVSIVACISCDTGNNSPTWVRVMDDAMDGAVDGSGEQQRLCAVGGSVYRYTCSNGKTSCRIVDKLPTVYFSRRLRSTSAADGLICGMDSWVNKNIKPYGDATLRCDGYDLFGSDPLTFTSKVDCEVIHLGWRCLIWTDCVAKKE